MPAAGPRQGRGAGLALGRTLSGPHGGVVPGGSLALRFLGCVRCGGLGVWTPSLTRPVSRTMLLSTGASPGAPGLFRVDAHTQLKLEKCELMQETMQYLVFEICFEWWTPRPLLYAEV